MSPITKTRTARSDEWSTPQWLFDHFNKEFGFTFDGAALPWNAKCERFPVSGSSGLAAPWYSEVVWLNPPYSDIAPWVEKAARESTATHSPATVVCLVPNAPDTLWWRDWVEPWASEIRLLTRSLLPSGRVHFEREDGFAGRAGFSSALVIYRAGVRERRTLVTLREETNQERT